jgi:hypothetical protein
LESGRVFIGSVKRPRREEMSPALLEEVLQACPQYVWRSSFYIMEKVNERRWWWGKKSYSEVFDALCFLRNDRYVEYNVVLGIPHFRRPCLRLEKK